MPRSRIITLTTDYGSSGPRMGLLKGHILHADPDAYIVDISHDIPKFDILEAAYVMSNTCPYYPTGTVHIANVFGYNQPITELIAFEKDGHIYLGPNNGLYSIVFESLDVPKYRIEFDRSLFPFQSYAIAHVIRSLKLGHSLSELGEPLVEFVQKLNFKPVVTASQIRGTIIFIDDYGNAVLNVTKSLFEKHQKARRFRIYYKSRETIQKIHKHYGEVPVGDIVCVFNGSEHLEIAINAGNAAQLLSLEKHQIIQIDFI